MKKVFSLERLPPNWKSEELGNVVEFVGGSQPPKETFQSEPFEGGVRLVQIRDFRTDKFPTFIPKNLARRHFDETDVMIGRYGPPVFQILRGLSGSYNVALMKASPKAEMSKDYLFHLLQEPRLHHHVVANSERTAGQSGVNLTLLEAIKIPLPPLAEQRRIAEVLDRAEALRAKRRAALAQLDSLTQSLFLDLFGDPATNVKGWPKATLGDVTEMVTGYPFRSEEYVTNGDSVRLCRGANILPGRIDWSDLARWPESKAAGLAKFNLEAGDVVIAMDRPWISEGFKIARVQPEDCPALLVQRVARLQGGKKLPNEFLFHLLNQLAFTRHCRPTETTIPHISPKDIRSFAFPLPPVSLQREFARRVTAVEALKKAQRASLAELDALFASLQHRAFRGEL